MWTARAVFAGRLVNSIIRERMDERRFTVAELTQASDDPGCIEASLRIVASGTAAVISEVERQRILGVLRRSGQKWTDAHLAAIEALEVIGDGSEVGRLERFLASVPQKGGRARPDLSRRTQEVIAVLKARRADRMSSFQLLRGSQPELATGDLLHASVSPGVSEPDSLLRASRGDG
ncbi:MAG TPA: hypothetical protein VKT77_13120 [Chthonomonadaceae bacterium]|nr:hypothetical protein [Chthonomonadaceae bacterium]